MLPILVLLQALASPYAAESDFSEGLAPWRPQEGQWRVEDGALAHADPYFRGGAAALPGRRLSDFTLEADIRISELYWDEETVWAGFVIMAKDIERFGSFRDGYVVAVRVNGELFLADWRTGEMPLQTQTHLRPAETTVRLRIEAEGGSVTIYGNGERLAALDVDRDAGEVGLVNYGNVTVFDNVRAAGTVAAAQRAEPVQPEHPAPKEAPAVEPLPRIEAVRTPGKPGHFRVAGTGEPFVPVGFNYVVLETPDAGWHATFNVGRYDPDAAEEALARMEALGANCVRFWAWGAQDETGFTGGPEGRGLNGAYMENLVDFLRRATRHGVYVMPILDETPHNAYYDSLAAAVDQPETAVPIAGYNRQYLAAPEIAAKAQGAADFVRYVKEADAGLLNTVLGWSLANEVFVNHSELPFLAEEGEATIANGVSYSMADPTERQACYDDGIVFWANEIAAAIREVDPDANVTAGMWTADAHGREPVSGLLPDDKDPRRPPRPAVLTAPDCSLDFIDVHIYPWTGGPAVKRSAHERDAVIGHGAPALVGEYGVFKRQSAETAKEWLASMLRQAYEMGYAGSLFWVWDLSAIPGQTWSAVEAGMAEYVTELHRSGQLAPYRP